MQALCEKGAESMLKHVMGVCFEFTWVGSLVVKICSICEHGSHMAASAQLAGLDMPAKASGSPQHRIKASRSQLGTCMTRQLFDILNACMHRFEATACRVTRQQAPF